MRRKVTALTAAALWAIPLTASAQETEVSIGELVAAVDAVWVVLASCLVFLMQAGFTLVEAGFTRAKNTANIVMKNFMDFCVGALAYWAVGFGLAYGGSTIGGLIGYGEFFFNNPDRAVEWFFQVVFAATAATIVSGAMAERTKFSAYLLYTPFISGIIYPIVTHWTWGGGWLSELGYVDFAGSGIVHLVGGVASLVGVMAIGPRIGKYDEEGRPLPIPGHSLLLGALGVFILWFGWYGFNAGSTLAAVGQNFAAVAITTTLSASAGALTAMVVAWNFRADGKPDVGLTLNGALAGLVGITAGTANVSNLGAVVIGIIAGVLVVVAIVGFERIHIDDPVGAISVHGVVGIWGVIAVGLFDITGGGLLYGGGLDLLLAQLVGVVAIVGWTAVTSYLVFGIIKATWGLRVTADEEIMGLDRLEHGNLAYPEFMEQIADPAALDPVG